MAEDKTIPDGDALVGRDYRDVDITDDFMFSYIMRQPEICMELLQYLFPDHKIRSVRYIHTEDAADTSSVNGSAGDVKSETQKTLAEIFGKKGVRLDVYLDDGNTVYNIELQTTKQLFLPKRSRYYQAQIDINLLERGANYDQLRPSYVIFICTFDPFGMGRYRYSFRNMCEEENGLSLNDEAYKIFFSTTGTKGEISDNLRELLRYMDNTRDYPVSETKYDLIRKINDAVGFAKKDEDWRRAYMTYQIHQRDAELRGEARGEARGIILGEARGEGEARGKLLGEEKKARESAQNFYKMGISVEIIADGVGYTVDTVKKWLGLIPA